MTYRNLALSTHPAVAILRKIRRELLNFTLPAPRWAVRPALWIFIAGRTVYHFALRVFICEPLFKAYCKQVGRRVRTGVYVHWIQGKGDILVGDDVLVDGKCSINFAARFCKKPTLIIGDHTIISHACSFTIGKRITIGKHCLIATGAVMLDSSGHPTDPAARLAGLPPTEDKVRPIILGDNVWIGQRAMIFPGVTIGEGSVIGACAVVTKDVPAYTLVAGNPARPIAALQSLDHNCEDSVVTHKNEVAVL